MNIANLLPNIFAVNKWVILVLACLYFVPAIKLLTFYIRSGRPLVVKINKTFGIYEHVVAWFRDSFGILYLLGFATWHIYIFFIFSEQINLLLGLLAISLIGLSVVNYIRKFNDRKIFLGFIVKHPDICPKEFFTHLLCISGIIRHKLPNTPNKTVNLAHIDFRKPTKTKNNLYILIVGIWSTIWLKKLSLVALKQKGKEFFMDLVTALSVVWGTRVVELIQAEVVIEGRDRLDKIEGRVVYLFNHLSFLDLTLAPLITVGCAMTAKKIKLTVPRFMLAKDHFLDNPIFKSFLGIGLIAKQCGMIFVDRKGGAKKAVDDAVSKIISEHADILIFPQGTRAYGRENAKGERIDGGYYTVGSLDRLKKDAAHLKKGAAHIAVKAASLLDDAKNEMINLVPVGIVGTGVIIPRGSISISKNKTIRLKIGEPIVVHKQDVANMAGEKQYLSIVADIHKKIDDGLKTSLAIHANLERRFFEDIHKFVEPMVQEDISVAMKQWRGDDFLVHAILDYIYTCKSQQWWFLSNRLIYMIREDVPRSQLLEFKQEIAEMI